MGALKYFILKVDPKKRMLFNPAESIDLNGNTGPFIQYTHARIRSVIRKGEKVFGAAVGGLQKGSLQSIVQKGEQDVIKVLYRYPAVIAEAAANLSPAVVANYAYEMAKAFNHFYHDNVIVDEAKKDVSALRLQLASLTADVIKECLRLLGMVAPERM